jgi:AcrR family transcriptional regulator
MSSVNEQPKRRGRPPSGGREAILEATLALIRERGIANLTTRGVAARAGVSEASVFYHFGDRQGLLQAVFEHGMAPLEYLTAPQDGSASPKQVLAGAARALDTFFDAALPVMMAAQSDPELRDALAVYMTNNNLGPHRGVQALGAYLKTQQAAGRIDPEIDVEPAALMLIGSCFTRAMQRKILGQSRSLPSLERVVATLDQMLRSEPPAPR